MSTRLIRKAALPATLAVAFAAAGMAWFVNRVPPSPFEEGTLASSQQADLVTRGEYVARLSDCVACHTTPNRAPFSGGLKMDTPLGAIYTTNITPDKQTGIGNYSLAQFDRAVRHGVAANGHRLYPAMPYPSYAKLSDDDIRALYAFFQSGVKPVAQTSTPSEIPWPLNMRWPIALWNSLFANSEAYQEVPEQDALWNRGSYIVEGPGHCGSCHTPRGIAFNEKGLDHTDEQYLSGALLDGWYAPSLRNDPNTGMGRWAEEEIVQFLKTGRNKHAVVYGSMTEAFNNSTQFMTDDDLTAVAHYLKALPGDPKRDGKPWAYEAGAAKSLSFGEQLKTPGAQTYAAKCSSCHGLDGLGQPTSIPPLAGRVSSLSEETASSINITLNGSQRVVFAGLPDGYRMPAFRDQLTDSEMAAVLTFIRTSWGNHGGAVGPEAVKDLREKTDPASSSPIILQMR